MSNRLAQRVSLSSDVLDVKAKLAEAGVQKIRVQNAVASQKEQLNLLMGRDVTTPFEIDGTLPAAPFEGDINTVIAQAISARPDVIKARLQVEEADLARKVAKAAYIPDVSLAMSYYTPLSVDGMPQNITTLGLQLDWEPFDYGRKANSVSARALAVQQARNAQRDAEDKAAIEIRTAFRKLDESKATLQVARLSQDAARERARVRNTQFEVDAALISDVLQAQAALANANNDYEQALLSFWRANADFEHALGQD
jgi:outer membrane protein TolC